MLIMRGAGLVVGVLVLASCVPGVGPAPAHGPRHVGVQLPEPPATSGPADPCTADQVDVVIEGLDAATGNRWGWLRVMNRSDVPCTIEGSPGLLVDQGGRPLDLLVEHGPSADLYENPEVTGPVRLEQQQSATAEVFWRGYGTAADLTTGQTIRATLHDGTVLDVAMGTYVPDPVFDLVDGGGFTIGPWIASGYGSPGYDDPGGPVEATTPCASSDLVAGVTGVRGFSGDADAEPAATLWVANVGLVPCIAGDLALVSGAGEVMLHDGRGVAVLRPGHAVGGAVTVADLEAARADPGPWHVRAGDVDVRVVVR